MSEDTAFTTHWVWAAVPGVVRTARLRTVARLRGWGFRLDAASVECLELIVSELVTNAVRHSGSDVVTVALAVAPDRGEVLLSVFDSSRVVPVVREPDPDAEGGWGMPLVAALAKDWGVYPTHAGKAVWATVALPLPARAGDRHLASALGAWLRRARTRITIGTTATGTHHVRMAVHGNGTPLRPLRQTRDSPRPQPTLRAVPGGTARARPSHAHRAHRARGARGESGPLTRSRSQPRHRTRAADPLNAHIAQDTDRMPGGTP